MNHGGGSLASSVEAQERSSPFASPPITALLIVAIAVATRIVAWWNPVAHVDDQFYLLAGEELLKGNWPYVDVWDRKPLGLFLLYAGIAWIGGGSILGLNLIATAFAAATAWVIRQIGLHFASPKGATLGALAYLFVIPLVGGQTGQSPVFYNLLMAGAGWLLIDATRAEEAAPIVRRALWAMLLCGLAMAIKQISFIEGAYFGLAFLWLLHRQGTRFGALARTALTMVLVALFPTFLTFALYALAGELDVFIYSTVTSIFLKSGWSATSKLAGLLFFLLNGTALLLMAIAGAVMRHRQDAAAKDRILVGWMVTALLGYAAVPHFFDHYALPVLVPLSVSAATLFDRRSGRLFFTGLAAYCVTVYPAIRDVQKNIPAKAEFDQLAAVVDQARQGGCIFIGDGPTHLYSATGACHVTRYLFPDHLNLLIEADAIGVDTGAELQHILNQRPAVIVTQDREDMERHTIAYRSFLGRMKRAYDSVYISSLEVDPRGIRVWQRKDLVRPTS